MAISGRVEMDDKKDAGNEPGPKRLSLIISVKPDLRHLPVTCKYAYRSNNSAQLDLRSHATAMTTTSTIASLYEFEIPDWIINHH